MCDGKTNDDKAVLPPMGGSDGLDCTCRCCHLRTESGTTETEMARVVQPVTKLYCCHILSFTFTSYL